MTSDTLARIASIDDGGIDRDRLVNGDSLSAENFCSICQSLLWKPRSCSTCQQLFCEKCIRTWLENPNGNRKCPFRCQPYIDRRCPPYVQSVLSRLNIRCRNASFGCLEILPYDQLEYHENVHCQYLTQQCSECDRFVLISKMNEHREIRGLCIPHPIKCTICQEYIEKIDFQQHFYTCREKRIDELNRITLINENIRRVLTNQPPVYNNELTFFQTVQNNFRLINQQKQFSRLPTSLKGIEAAEQARAQNSGYFYNTLVMLEFILLNWRKLPFFIQMFGSTGITIIFLMIVGIYGFFAGLIKGNIYIGSISLILSTYLVTYGCSCLIQYISDTILIFIFLTVGLLVGSSSDMPLEAMEMNPLFNRPIITTLYCCFTILSTKFILFGIRLYFSWISIYIAIHLVLFLNFYITLKISHNLQTTSRLTMPV